MNTLLAVVEPNNWAGAVVVLVTCLGTIASLTFLFGWDDDQHTKTDRDRDILKGPLG